MKTAGSRHESRNAESLSLRQLTYAVIDVETTGLSVRTGDRICEVAVVVGRGGVIVDQLQSLVNPGRSISRGAAAVNGISDRMVQNAPTFRKLAPDLLQILGADNTVLVGHNSSFDLSFISAELRQAGYEPPNKPVLDTLALARRCYSFGSNRLGHVAQSLGIQTSGLHRALADATITWHVLKRFLWDLEARGITTLADMLAEQGSLTSMNGWNLGKMPKPLMEWDGTQPYCPIQGLPPLVEQAMRAHTPLRIRYTGSDGRTTVRVVQPRKVTLHSQATFLVGFCHLRQEERAFRLDRIVEMRVETIIA
ncbi:MAG TPA: exonuclease domain-containing protein [Chloroflexia bacterium]|nr:exonuclease domain-containing protein [Chloroflexia bacterium]